MPLLLVLLSLFLIFGSVLGWYGLFKIRQLNDVVLALRAELNSIRRSLPQADSPATSDAARASAETRYPISDFASGSAKADDSGNSWQGPEPVTSGSGVSLRTFPAQAKATNRLDILQPVIEQLKQNWMTWLGGLSVALAGIFMVRYSIEQGYLGPSARILLALVTGLLLHGAAEWLRRHNIGNYQAFAALAGAASITLYAALLAALHLYQLVPPLPVFILLAVVSVATMALAVLHGPVLAIIGILGAYIVPLLVDTGSSSVAGVLVYAFIISVAAMALMQFVYRYWLWAGMVLGAVGWWFIAILSGEAEGIRGYYLAALFYLFAAAPGRDWLLTQIDAVAENPATPGNRISQLLNNDAIAFAPVRETLILLLAAFGLSILAEPSVGRALLLWMPLLLLVFAVSRKRHSLRWLGWISLAIQWFAFFTLGLGTNNTITLVGLAGADQNNFLTYALVMAVFYPLMACWVLRQGRNRAIWISLALVAPLLWLALSYLLVPGLTQSLNWGALAVSFGLVYFAFAAWQLRNPRATPDVEMTVWLIMAGHFAYSLAVAIVFRQAGLTLALAAQLVSLAWVIKTFELPKLALLLKLILAAVVLRLTTNPWLLSYPVDVHWSLWSYGGSTVFCILAAWQLRQKENLGKWLEMASLHLLVLTIWAELRYWLYDGDIFTNQLELLEVAINCALWSSLSLIYYLRSKVSNHLQGVYTGLGRVMLTLAAAAYMLMLLPLNPLFNGASDTVSSRPVFNLLLLAYGFPVVSAAIAWRYHEPWLRKAMAGFAALAGFYFVSIEIRHLWQGRLNLTDAMSSGELYTYSIVWLAIAVSALLAGGLRFGPRVYQAGLVLMMLVIGKIFLVDMADLQGLLRVASFMGLGLCLLALAYFYQRFNIQPGKQKLLPDQTSA